MFELIRNHKRWMLFLVLILILPSFVFFGIEGYSRFVAGDQPMANVGNTSITRAEYDMARRQQLDQGRQMLGAAFDPSIFDTPEARRQTLEQLIDARVLSQAVADDMLTVSDNVVRRTIAQIPSVQNNGRFDPEIYARLLAAQGMSPASFEAGLRWELAQGLVLEPVASSAMVPDSLVSDLLAALQRERTVRVAEFVAADYFDQVALSDADIEAYYQANVARFEVPESVDVEYVVLDSAAALAGVDVSDQDIAQYYEQNKNRFRSEARRSVSHILIEAGNDAEAARQRIDEIAARLKEQPEAFAELARAESQDPGSASQGGSLGWISAGMLVPEFETVAFELPQGTISEPVQTDFGWHLIRVDEAQDSAVRSLDEVRDQLAEEIRLQKGGARFGEMASQLTNLVYDQAENLAAASDGLGLEIQRLEGVQRSAVPESAPSWFNDGRVIQTLFSSEVLRSGRNSGVIELAPDQLVVVRAAQVEAAHQAPLSEVADGIREILQREQALARAQSEGETALKQLQEGAQAGVEFGPELQVSRAAPAALGNQLIEAILDVQESAELPAYVGAPSGSAYLVAEVSAIAAQPEPEASQIQAEQGALENALGQAEALAVLQQLRRHYKVAIDPYAEQLIQEGDEATF